MTHVCRQCSRVNPPDASFCYWDGVLLAGGGGGPINAGSAPFPSQFVFPGGQACRNFDQLAMTCQHNWKAAVELLKQGFFAGFLGGMGRADLAMTAAEAARFPDADRGLDQLLARLPSHVLEPPKVRVEPSMVSLGVLPMGTDRKLDLHLTNLGMRLAYGSIVSDCKWLTLGEGQGASQKLFQFGAEATIPVHVKGRFLRAGNQPLEGHLLVDSNGGTMTVTVRADVPIIPFSEGVLAGAHTPRQIAEKARAHPKEATLLFEKGLVSMWFARNGWTYPVQGPSVAGLGGVQQFFEALGLAKPPKVLLKTPGLQLKADPGQTLKAAIDVATSEKKHVFAFAVSDQAWVVPGSQPKQGKSPTAATIPLTINAPWTPGQTLQAKVTVTANGNQKFPVPLTLTITGSPGDYLPAQAIPLTAGAASAGPVPIMATPIADGAVPMLSAEVVTADVVEADGLRPRGSGPVPVMARVLEARPPARNDRASPRSGDSLIDLSRYRKRGTPLLIHLLPALGLLLALALLTLRDLTGTAADESADIDTEPRLKLYFDYGKVKEFNNYMTFGVVMVDPSNPLDPNPKKLTYDPFGRTNSTLVSIDGTEKLFGFGEFGKFTKKPMSVGPYGGQTVMFQFAPEPIFVTQSVTIIPGEVVDSTAGEFKRPLNTCLIKYKVENHDVKMHKIGMRVVIDTFIGKNDGTPFTIPGTSGLVSTMRDLRGLDEIPDFIQALEFPNLDNPGTVVQMNLKLSDALAPDRVSLTHWPGHYFGKWEVPMKNIAEDSAIVLYWNPTYMKPGEVREMAYSYGLGNLKGGRLGLTIGGTLAVGREMTVVAYVADPQPGETATLKLPAGFELVSGSAATQRVPPGQRGTDGKLRPSPVTWRLRPGTDGRHVIHVATSTNLSASQAVTIRKKGIF